MSKYFDALERIFDLPPAKALAEAQGKLGGTVCYLNGKKEYMVSFDKYGVTISVNGTKKEVESDEIQSLDVWNPESGVYQTDKGGILVLNRIPKRQWLRSFSARNYEISSFDGAKHTDFMHIVDESRTDFWVNKEKHIFYFNIEIGRVLKQKKVQCTNQIFVQEMKDWLARGGYEKIL